MAETAETVETIVPPIFLRHLQKEGEISKLNSLDFWLEFLQQVWIAVCTRILDSA